MPVLALTLLCGQMLAAQAFPLGAAERAAYAAFLGVAGMTDKKKGAGFNDAVYAYCLAQLQRELPAYQGFERRYMRDARMTSCFTTAANPDWLDLLVLRAPPGPFDGHFRSR